MIIIVLYCEINDPYTDQDNVNLSLSLSNTVISGQFPAGNVLIFPQTVVGAGYRKVWVM